jgi:hypothetical protein
MTPFLNHNDLLSWLIQQSGAWHLYCDLTLVVVAVE